MSNKELDLSCFSYLASARVLNVDEYPKPNYGAEVRRVIDTLAADGPMVAIAASHLGLKVGIIANAVGENAEGKEILDRLKRNNVVVGVETNPSIKTPFIVVLSDKEGNREWFPYIPSAIEELKNSKLDMIGESLLAYIDYYSITREAANRVVDFGHKSGTPLFLNLGGSPLQTEERVFLKSKNIRILQTNLDYGGVSDGFILAKDLFENTKPEISIVTLGEKGAVAVTSYGEFRAYAYLVDALHVHGAGAAFSAGFSLGYLKGWNVQRSLGFACALGSLNCTVETGFDTFSQEDVERFMQSGKRNL